MLFSNVVLSEFLYRMPAGYENALWNFVERFFTSKQPENKKLQVKCYLTDSVAVPIQFKDVVQQTVSDSFCHSLDPILGVQNKFALIGDVNC